MTRRARLSWRLVVAAFVTTVGTACSESRTDDAAKRPDGTPPTAAPARTPRPEDSATPGPLPRPGSPSTATDNPTGTGTGR